MALGRSEILNWVDPTPRFNSGVLRNLLAAIRQQNLGVQPSARAGTLGMEFSPVAFVLIQGEVRGMPTHPIHVAIAILHQNGQFLMQLRDNISGILYPGCWGFFGGHLESEESPLDAVRRELLEEINYVPERLTWFDDYGDETVVRHVFYGSVTVPRTQLTLTEGWDFDFLSPEDIQRGDRYSAIANEIRPLGQIHRQILLDFMKHHPGITVYE
jgi:8-oxo-dGTP pyrophosphatase MutT (NUDIX family)